MAEDLVRLEVGPPAHGGHAVARVGDRPDGRVVFVRHAIPGEVVLAAVTEGGESARYWRADVVEILTPSPDRVPSAWPEAGPGGVGGGELAHVALPAQRRWKADVLTEALRRIGRLDIPVEVRAAPGDEARGGLGYRTRIDLVADGEGRAGMRRHRSHDVVALSAMPLATEDVARLAGDADVFARSWQPGARLEIVVPASGGEGLLLVDGVPWRGGRADRRTNARRSVTEVVRADTTSGVVEHRYRVAADGFWQVHRAAPAVLTTAVLDGLGDVSGATVLDLYSGAGLFTAPLAAAVGPAGRVVAVEGDARAVKDARRNAHDLAQVELRHGAVDRVLGAPADHGIPAGADAVVLDPPRAGAGRRVIDALAGLGARRVVYVACDPAALARDLGYLAGHGYDVAALDPVDLFPMTHHLEAVAVLVR